MPVPVHMARKWDNVFPPRCQICVKIFSILGTRISLEILAWRTWVGFTLQRHDCGIVRVIYGFEDTEDSKRVGKAFPDDKTEYLARRLQGLGMSHFELAFR